MKTLLKNNKPFYLLYMAFALIGLAIVLLTDKFELHSSFNSLVGFKLSDEFFKYITYLGDGLFLIAIAVILFFFNLKNALFLLVSYGLSGGFTQFLKSVFFDDVNRPFFYSSYSGLKLKVVEGVEMFIHNSFPSGHSTSAFCLFFCLSYMVKPVWAKVLLFVIGILTAFSRVYLSQHFFEDIYVGSIIGVTFSSLAAWLFYVSPLSTRLIKTDQPIQLIFSKSNG